MLGIAACRDVDINCYNEFSRANSLNDHTQYEQQEVVVRSYLSGSSAGGRTDAAVSAVSISANPKANPCSFTSTSVLHSNFYNNYYDDVDDNINNYYYTDDDLDGNNYYIGNNVNDKIL